MITEVEHKEKSEQDTTQHLQPKQQSSSWANLVNLEISKNTEDKPLITAQKHDDKKQTHEIDCEKVITVNEILSIDYKKVPEMKLLEYQVAISNNLRKYIRHCMEKDEIFDVELNLPKLEWLLIISKYLSDKNNLELQKHILRKFVSVIPRSSYKFCEFGYECTFNYQPSSKSKNGCYSQHFVHNLVYEDIHTLIDYFKSIEDKTGHPKINIQEVSKCINTISYVINHMLDEIKNVEYYKINSPKEKYNSRTYTSGKDRSFKSKRKDNRNYNKRN